MLSRVGVFWSVLLVVLCVNSAAVAQELEEQKEVDPYFVESSAVTSTVGPSVITRNVLQDRNGLFWLATWNGVVQYDGTTFTNVTNKEGLRRYRVFCVMEDHDGNIWLGTVGAGVYRFDGETYTNFTTKDGLVDDVVLSIYQDRDRNIWFGGLGLTKYDGTTFTTYSEEDGFTNSDVNSIVQSDDGTMWFGTRSALFRYDGKSFVNVTRELGLNIVGYIPVVIDGDDQVWFGGENGVYFHDGAQVHHICDHSSYTLFLDSKGMLWHSGSSESRQGVSVLNRIDPSDGAANRMIKPKSIEVPAAALFGMTEDSDGKIWFGTERGIGRIDGDAARMFGFKW